MLTHVSQQIGPNLLWPAFRILNQNNGHVLLHSSKLLLQGKFNFIISLLSTTGLPDLETVIIVPFLTTDTSSCDISHITNRRVTFCIGRRGLFEV